MTSGGKRRLERLEAALVPLEAMAVWLQDVRQQHRSVPDLARSLQGKPDEAFPLFTLTRQAETAARTRFRSDTRGAESDALSRAERDAVRDVSMLFYLFMETNGQFLQEKRALCLLVALLLRLVHDWFRDSRMPEWDEPLDGRLQLAMAELYGWQTSVERLGERYFQGICPLLPATEEQLAWIVGQGEMVVEMFNDHLEWETRPEGSSKRQSKLPKPLDLALLKRNAEAWSKTQVSYLVDLARA